MEHAPGRQAAKTKPKGRENGGMWCSKVLVAYDGSAPSRKALELARSIAEADAGIELVLVHVMRLYSSGAAGVAMDTVFMADAEPVREELQQVADALRNPASVRLLKGSSPADLIVRCAEEEGCDLIVTGSRGQGGVKGYLGSVSYAVVQGSPVAVLVAKDDAGSR